MTVLPSIPSGGFTTLLPPPEVLFRTTPKDRKKKKSKRSRKERSASPASVPQASSSKLPSTMAWVNDSDSSSDEDNTVIKPAIIKLPPGLAAKQQQETQIVATAGATQNEAGAAALKAFEMHHQFLHQQAMQSRFMNAGTKKQRELYVGNLPIGQVTPESIKDAFAALMRKIPEYQQKYGLMEPVRDVQISSSGTFAFVEFSSEEMCSTAMLFDKMEMKGRAINCGRPQGYADPVGGPPDPMDIQPLIRAGLLPSDEKKKETVELAAAQTASILDRKQRELYVGNLPIGMVTQDVLMELFAPACKYLPQFIEEKGDPVVNVTLNADGRYAFVEMQSDKLASAALSIYDKMELFGRPMNVGRPSGYTKPRVVETLEGFEDGVDDDFSTEQSDKITAKLLGEQIARRNAAKRM